VRVAVLGAGVSGLAAALRLQELGLDVTVFDRAPRAGGCIQTLRDSGYTMELGPDSLLVDKPAARDWLRKLGLDDRLVPMLSQYRGSRIVHRGRLRPIPSEFRLFTPTSIPALLTSGIFSPLGIARAAMEPFVPPRMSEEDESLASFVTRRLGRELLERLAQPLIGGIYSGDPQRLSMQATLPQFVQMERTYGSLVRAMAAIRRSGPGGVAPQLMSLRGGLQTLVDAMTQRLGAAIRISSEVTSLSRNAESWTIAFADGDRARADVIICALPAHAAARILRGCDDQLAGMLDVIRYNSIATVNLAFDARDLPPLPPTPGFVVPFVEHRRITAATITTQKYPERSPQNGMLIRVFAGGALQPEVVDSSDEELAQLAREELEQLLGIRAQPNFAVVQRWRRLLPEYGVGHTALVRSIEERAALSGLALAGSAYHGVGIPDCLAGGTAAAERFFATNVQKSG
jgi:oxygen-dependent protoporphyrinogen oxidase